MSLASSIEGLKSEDVTYKFRSEFECHSLCQATLQVKKRGFRVWSTCMQAPLSFLELTATMLPLQNAVLAGLVQGMENSAFMETKKHWTSLAINTRPAETSEHIQKAWDTLVTAAVLQRLLNDDANTPTDMTRLKAAAALHSRGCLHAPPITTVS